MSRIIFEEVSRSPGWVLSIVGDARHRRYCNLRFPTGRLFLSIGDHRSKKTAETPVSRSHECEELKPTSNTRRIAQGHLLLLSYRAAGPKGTSVNRWGVLLRSVKTGTGQETIHTTSSWPAAAHAHELRRGAVQLWSGCLLTGMVSLASR